MKLTDFQKKLAWGFGIIAIIFLWIAFPLIFKYWVFKLLVTPPFTTEAFASLGPIGDIFGGLTAFFTSLTLIIVLYSAHLQNQANKDARDAMADQLQQAKDATANQLQQAKDATNEQLQQARDALAAQLNQAKVLTEQQIVNAKELANIQLEQARESMEQQLALAKETHNAQIKESRYAIFLSIYNSLLTQRNEKFIALDVKDTPHILTAHDIFYRVSKEFFRLLNNEWSDITTIEKKDVKKALRDFTSEINNNQAFIAFYSYFHIYDSLLMVIKSSDLDTNDQRTFVKILSNTMSFGEQISLMWLMIGNEKYEKILNETGLFTNNISPTIINFILHFDIDKSCFSEKNCVLIENRLKTPA